MSRVREIRRVAALVAVGVLAIAGGQGCGDSDDDGGLAGSLSGVDSSFQQYVAGYCTCYWDADEFLSFESSAECTMALGAMMGSLTDDPCVRPILERFPKEAEETAKCMERGLNEARRCFDSCPPLDEDGESTCTDGLDSTFESCEALMPEAAQAELDACSEDEGSGEF